MERVSILGSGMAGWGAAYRLHQEKVPSITYDKNDYHGGHTASWKFDTGFIFDEGPHVSFTKHEYLQKLFAQSVDEKYEVIQATPNNVWKGIRIKHPADLQSPWIADRPENEMFAGFYRGAECSGSG